jgi:hypothetical protein
VGYAGIKIQYLSKVDIGGQDAHPTRVLLLIGVRICEDGIFGDFMAR